MINAIAELKERLNDARVWRDASEIFAQTEHDLLVEYADVLTKAKRFTDLTMRDDFLLQCANHQIRNNVDAMEGNMVDANNMPLSIRIQMIINQFRDDEKAGAEPNINEIIDEIEHLVNQNEA